MRVLVTGVKGQLGYDVMKTLAADGIEGIGADLEQFDITDFEQTRDFIIKATPDAVIHCSAYTAVDKAEENFDICYNVNANGPANIAKVCKELDIKMAFISTDYVFPGDGTMFYNPDDKTEPKGAYGKTKLAGENSVRSTLTKYFIVRTSWVFGINGGNFVKTMLHLGKTHDTLTVVSDQIGSPTYTPDLARLLVDMIKTEKYGTYHATNEGICAWNEFAEAIFAEAGMNVKIVPVTTEQYNAPAPRPKNSRMSKEKLSKEGFTRLPDWKDALKRYMIELKEAKEN